jgi:hypothetical protein
MKPMNPLRSQSRGFEWLPIRGPHQGQSPRLATQTGRTHDRNTCWIKASESLDTPGAVHTWIQFSDKQPPTVTSVLAEFGFHWNNTRRVWQHPCGAIRKERAAFDPRKRYRSYFAADAKPT